MLWGNFIIRKMLASEHAEKEVWDLLSLQITAEHLNPSDRVIHKQQHIDAMRTLFRQGRQLYTAGGTISLESSPLIDFYCYSMLAKILAMRRSQQGLETLTRSHGLSFALDNSQPVDTDHMYVTIANRGMFVDLLKALPRPAPIEDYAGAKVNLTGLLYYDIDLHDYIPMDAKSLPVHSVKHRAVGNTDSSGPKGAIEIRLPGEQKPETFDRVKFERPDIDLSAFHTRNGIRIDKRGYPIFAEYNRLSELPDLAVEVNFAGQMFLIAPVSADKGTLSFYQLEILYLILFAASNLVRYHPVQWIELLADERRIWHLRKAIALARRSYPNYILNFVAEECHTILPPGTLHYS